MRNNLRKYSMVATGKNNATEASKMCTVGERKIYDILFRGEHPDTRTVKQWRQDMNKRSK